MMETGSLLLLIFGFGFVIFFHELGHFLAAKWVGIKVEQFAVGFGHALLSWRKGIGLRFGSTQKEFEERARAYLTERGQVQSRSEADDDDERRISDAAGEMGLGETEYRLNWIPLGGYVKMLGQDDLRPNAQSADPRAYNRKSIGARMFVVSAGVIMNIILAAIGFMALFLIGFRVQPAVVGMVHPLSPAQKAVAEDGQTPAPLRAGDRILYYDDKYQHDYTKIQLNVALSGAGRVPMYVRRAEGHSERLWVTPTFNEVRGNLLDLGIEPPVELRGLKKQDAKAMEEENGPDSMLRRDMMLVPPEAIITAVNGQPVNVDEYWKFDRALQASAGKPVKLTVKTPDGAQQIAEVEPRFASPFGGDPLSFGGMIPRTGLQIVMPNSPARGKLLPGDVILQISYANGADPLKNPTSADLIERLSKAGREGQVVEMFVLRDGREVGPITGLTPNIKVAEGRYGLGLGLSYDDRHAVVAGVEEKSPAAQAALPVGSQITAINGEPVQSWFDVKRVLERAQAGVVRVEAVTPTGSRTFDMNFGADHLAKVNSYLYAHNLPLHERIEPRKTKSPLVAAGWGVTETRDFILQFYLTLHRMFQGRVSYKNMMGPVGIFNAGRHFAYKGPDWLIWFLAMISANLAVVNFLPIPIVDGGLFTFLIIEKIQGRPLSPKTQSIAQVVGLAIILSVFLLVTYQDVARLAN